METNDNVVDFVWGIMMPNYIQDICVFIKVEEASYLHQDPYLRKKVYDYCTWIWIKENGDSLDLYVVIVKWTYGLTTNLKGHKK